MRFLIASIALAATLAGPAAQLPGEGSIAFSDREYYDQGDSWEIFVVRPDGSGLRRVTRAGQRLFDSSSPDWSPDGRRIVFESRDRIFVIDANGKRLRQLTNGKFRDSSPAWSPKGGRIAFERRDAIWTMRADGKQQRRVTPGAGAAWSPDGRRIVFVRGHDLWTISANGGEADKLVANASNPSWSPDGRRIAFDGGDQGGIFVANADGTGRKRLGKGADPSWSPDGRRLAFSYAGISVMDGNGGNPRVILRGFPEMSGPAW